MVSQIIPRSRLRADLLKTIAYAKKYQCFPLKIDFPRRLISSTFYHDSAINRSLTSLHWSPRPRPGCYLFKLNRAKKIASFLAARFSEILFIGLTGSVATRYPRPSDDIDLLIIVKRNRLWLLRLKVKLCAIINGLPIRSRNSARSQDLFCFNLWLDESALVVPKPKQNLKNALDLVQMEVLWESGGVFSLFLKENSWATKWAANGYFRASRFAAKRFLPSPNTFYWPNLILFWFSYLYMKPAIRREYVTPFSAYFHPFG